MSAFQSLDVGTYCCGLGLPDPWPPVATGQTVEIAFGEGLLVLGFTSDRRLMARLMAPIEGVLKVMDIVYSCQIDGLPDSRLILILSWVDRKFTSMRINKKSVEGLARTPTAPGEIRLRPPPEPEEKPLALSAADIAAMCDRKRRWEGRTIDAKRLDGGEKQAFWLLQQEVLRAKEALVLAKSGRDHMLLDLSSRLRSLVRGRRPLGLLQTCAAILDMPLTIYVCANTEEPPPFFEEAVVIHFDGNEICQPPHTEPIDLDVWLGRAAIEFNGSAISHTQLIADIGDTLGSHPDLGIVESVQLHGYHGGDGEIRLAILANFLVRYTELVLFLAENVLSAPPLSAGTDNPGEVDVD